MSTRPTAVDRDSEGNAMQDRQEQSSECLEALPCICTHEPNSPWEHSEKCTEAAGPPIRCVGVLRNGQRYEIRSMGIGPDGRWHSFRGQCSECSGWLRLRGDGTVRRHRSDDETERRVWCGGSLDLPVAVGYQPPLPLADRRAAFRGGC